MKAKKNTNYDYIVDILKSCLATVVIDDFTNDAFTDGSDVTKDYPTGLQGMKNDLLTQAICQALAELGCNPVQASLEAFGKVYNLIQHKARQDTTSAFFDMPNKFKEIVSKIDTDSAPVDRLVKLYNDNFKELYAVDEEDK